MAVTVRPFRPEDAEVFLSVHHDAVRVTAARDYPASVIAAWAPLIQEADIEQLRTDQEGTRVIALCDEEVVGIGEVVPHAGELRACYVSPRHASTGIGRAIVAELEAIARSNGAVSLWLDSSLAAEPFYTKLGYEVVERGEHILRTGATMACVKMRKRL